MPNLRYTNEVIVSFGTAGDRVNIYAYLDKMQDRAIYTDTDSVLYIYTKGRRAPSD